MTTRTTRAVGKIENNGTTAETFTVALLVSKALLDGRTIELPTDALSVETVSLGIGETSNEITLTKSVDLAPLESAAARVVLLRGSLEIARTNDVIFTEPGVPGGRLVGFVPTLAFRLRVFGLSTMRAGRKKLRF